MVEVRKEGMGGLLVSSSSRAGEEGRKGLEMYRLPPVCQGGLHTVHTLSYFIIPGRRYSMARLQMRKLELLGLTHTLKIAQLVEEGCTL